MISRCLVLTLLQFPGINIQRLPAAHQSHHHGISVLVHYSQIIRRGSTKQTFYYRPNKLSLSRIPSRWVKGSIPAKWARESGRYGGFIRSRWLIPYLTLVA